MLFPKNKFRASFALILSVMLAALNCSASDVRWPDVPGVVIDHSPAASGQFIGSPSLVILTNGDYLASHDFFGPKSACARSGTTVIFKSSDHGLTWQETAHLSGAFWSNLFLHDGAVYLLGVNHEYGDIVIRRSDDDGKKWTTPKNSRTGRLTENGKFHTAPVPVVEHEGRLWRAFEDASDGTIWGKRFRAGVISVSTDANLLVATNWTFSNFLPRDSGWLGGNFNAWLEGNAVETQDDQIMDVLRVDTPGLPEKAALVQVTADGKKVSFQPTNGFVDFPGGAKKFTIRFDAQSHYYWSLTSIVSAKSPSPPGSIRNTLALIRSRDLLHWETRAVLLQNEETKYHGFQYADWQFDGNDLVAAVRTAFDDDDGGAHNNHDSNFLTFHRWQNFRELSDFKTAAK
jgi:hypothetical protein